MLARLKLQAQPRNILGKKTKKLRSQGLVPAHVFGAETNPVNIQLDVREFVSIWQDAGETQLVQLSIKGEKDSRNVLVAGVQKDHLTGKPIHVDFHQVVLTEEVEIEVPLKIDEKTAPAVQERKGILLGQIDEVTVKALPDKLPEEIVVDVSGLREVGDMIYVRDLPVPDGVEMITEPDRAVAIIETAEVEEEELPEKEVLPEEVVAAEEKPEEVVESEASPGPKEEEQPKGSEVDSTN
jgi:large subunit ribosomal protein L25